MKLKTITLAIAAGSMLAACATPTELRYRQVTFAASSISPNAEKTLVCVAKAWEQATQQPVSITKFETGYTAIAQTKGFFGTNTDFVIDSNNARTGGAVFQLWSSMNKDSTNKLIDIIQPCL